MVNKKITQQVWRGWYGPATLPCQKKNLHQASSHMACTLHGRYRGLGIGLRIWVMPCYHHNPNKIHQQHLPRLASCWLHDKSALLWYRLYRGDSFHFTCQTLPCMVTWHIDHFNLAVMGRLFKSDWVVGWSKQLSCKNIAKGVRGWFSRFSCNWCYDDEVMAEGLNLTAYMYHWLQIASETCDSSFNCQKWQ